MVTKPAPDGVERRARHARAVVLAMGYYERPNRLGVPGEDLSSRSHYYREAHDHYRQRVVIVGGKNSAGEAALELYRTGAQVTLVHRGAALGDALESWVRPDIENRIKEGSVAARFNTRVVEIRPAGMVDQSGTRLGPPRTRHIPADSVRCSRAITRTTDFLRRGGVEIEPRHVRAALQPGDVRDQRGGSLRRRRAARRKKMGTIFIENGRFHGERIARCWPSGCGEPA